MAVDETQKKSTIREYYEALLIAVIFVQGFLIEGLRFLGDWRNLLFGGLILLAMNVRPRGLIDAATIAGIKRLRIRNREPGNARTQGAE